MRNPELYFQNTGIREHIYLNNDVFAGFLREDFKEEFIESNYCNSLLRNRMLNELFHETVPPIIHEDDLNSMMFSIENRSPYLDSRLFEFAYSIPNEHLIYDGYGKYILREAVTGILNESVRTDRRKKGFNASIHSLVNLDQAIIGIFISRQSFYELLDRDKIKTVIRDRPSENSFSKFIFYFINAKVFLELFS